MTTITDLKASIKMIKALIALDSHPGIATALISTAFELQSEHAKYLAIPTQKGIPDWLNRVIILDRIDKVASDQDSRLFAVCDPCVGTGRMLLYASNYSMRGYGQDINPFCVKATMVNCYLYAPWFAKPLTVIDNLAKEAEALTGLSLEFQSLVKNKSLQSLIDPDNLAASRASGLLESINADRIDWFSVI